ncbi:helix-turn-helix transcriptional regulator [Actinobacillus delphinicola]|uniref:DeoR-like helix-turn-helix domain n=1 Tax=Actinobacillus delphinicola TaxID=51161 RepID=A0A448TRV9_9PAST|nr:WYL domain-containing protein [Actinobacillus delphinicola]VEJ08719.1 DeoR-like helix-turn-helix domain [Actinobacillus delphinicola]
MKNQKLAQRISDILFRLTQEEKLNVEELAEEFGVSSRTIERDFKERLNFFHWEECKNGFYKLDVKKSGFLTQEDIKRFANFASISNLLPEIDKQFFEEILTQSIFVKGLNYENIQHLSQEFKLINQAIKTHQNITFFYQKNTAQAGSYYKVSPYSLVNKNGIWYLIGIDNNQNKEKTFCFTKMNKLSLCNESFTPNLQLLDHIKNNDSISIGNQLPEIVVQVSPFAAPYFTRRNLLPNQEIVHQLEDGGLILTCKEVNELEVIPLVKYWIPHLTIISPKFLQERMENQLRDYLRYDEKN